MKRTLIPILAVVAVLTAMLSCDHKQQQVTKDDTQADSIINATSEAEDYQRVIELCDSFEREDRDAGRGEWWILYSSI